jgi:hypothetical protein
VSFVLWSSVPAAAVANGPWQIYALVDPRDERVRYVGVTIRPLFDRLADHIEKPTNREMRRWFADLDAQGSAPSVRLLIGVSDAWEDAERGWIAWFRARGELLNIDPGGICRDHKGKPIKARMKPDGGHDAPTKARWRRKAKKVRGPADPWAKTRGSTADKAAEISARQMKKNRGQ